jgi:benzoate/toluate 1,2-dioxygenase reductase subunit
VNAKAGIYSTTLLQRRRLSKRAIEIKLEKPRLLKFESGQRICLIHKTVERDYSIVSVSADPDICLCIRLVRGGVFSTELNTAPIGSRFGFTGPSGYFTFKPSVRPAVFVATGTGVAPFCSMIRAGVTGVTLLHGTKSPAELYYKSIFQSAAILYVPCLSAPGESSETYFHGRVTDYLQTHLAPGLYDFYLCGRQEMIRDVTFLVDEKFSGSYIYSEIFY